jgi:hypothetical protein
MFSPVILNRQKITAKIAKLNPKGRKENLGDGQRHFSARFAAISASFAVKSCL